MKRTAAATLLLALGILLMPVPTFAASKATFFGPIVPVECHCDNQAVVGGSGTVTTAPDYGCILQVIQNVINFAITFSTILFTLYIVIAGFGMITSRGNPEAVSKAKTRLTNVIIGLGVLLCSWLIVDFVMKQLYDDGKFGPWNAILAGDSAHNDRCIVARKPTAITTGTVGIITGGTKVGGAGTGSGTGSPGGTGGGGSCTPIPASQLVSIGGGFQLTADAASRFKSMQSAAAKNGVTLTPTSGYRSPDAQLDAWNNNGCSLVQGKAVCTTRTAAVPCSLGGSGSNHTRGTAVDIRLNSGVYTWLKSNAGQYGFYNNLPNDLPHWSDTGR